MTAIPPHVTADDLSRDERLRSTDLEVQLDGAWYPLQAAKRPDVAGGWVELRYGPDWERMDVPPSSGLYVRLAVRS